MRATFLLIFVACGPSRNAVAADRAAQSAAWVKERCPARSADGKFDRGCAAAALGSVNTQECQRELEPRGSGRVQVTFAPNGQITYAALIEGPFAGTNTGTCILAKFRGVQVPAFDGPPVHVKKSFSVE